MKMNCYACGTEKEVPDEQIEEFKRANPGEKVLMQCGKLSCQPYFQVALGYCLEVERRLSDKA